MEIVKDIICQVYGGEKSRKTIELVLNTFLPNYEKLNLDYATRADDETDDFVSEEEMIDYFIDNTGLEQTFYWNKHQDNPDKIMVGANFTNDDKLVVSLTLNVSEQSKEVYFNRLKSLLNSEIGVITYSIPADYSNGEDFVLKYG